MESNFKPTILYVEDDAGIREQLKHFLEYFSSELYVAVDGKEGLELYKKHTPDIVVTDIKMPIMNGIEMLNSIKELNTRQYAIFTTAHSDNDYLMEAIDLQVDGYILKPIDLDKLESKIEMIIEHISLKKELKEKLYFDYLTKLSSRYAFFEDIYAQKNSAVIIVDIDKFRIINEVYGSEMGSKVLVAFARELAKVVEDENYKVYRISADEFAIVDNITKDIDTHKYEDFIEKILDTLDNKHLEIDENNIVVDVTLGISIAQNSSYESAKMALDYAKKYKKPFMVYSSAINHKEESQKILKVKNEIALAIEEKRVKPVYQPIVNSNAEIVKYETLMRLQERQTKELILPSYFLDIAIKTKLYESLSSIVIFQALEILKNTKHSLSVNFTYSDIQNKAFIHKIEAFFLQNRDIGRRAIFEITESESIQNYDDVKNFIKRFKKYGVKIAIDDFGSGFSNFEYILEIEPDCLKIDGSLVKNIDTDEKSHTLVEAIVEFSHKLGIIVIAEYVHSQTIFEMLKKLDVDEYQGFYFWEPLENI